MTIKCVRNRDSKIKKIEGIEGKVVIWVLKVPAKSQIRKHDIFPGVSRG
jgi:hypothetical protein